MPRCRGCSVVGPEDGDDREREDGIVREDRGGDQQLRALRLRRRREGSGEAGFGRSIAGEEGEEVLKRRRPRGALGTQGR